MAYNFLNMVCKNLPFIIVPITPLFLFTFHSTKLDAMMRPLENKRKAMEKQNESKPKAERNQKACNSLKTNDGVVLSKVKESKEEKSKVSTSKEEDADAVWERYVDALRHEQQWQEIMAMRSGLGLAFVRRFDEVLQHFKRHVQAVGNEADIRSLSDAKHYFNNFNTLGSATFIRMKAELQSPSTRASTNTKTVTLPREREAIAVCRYRAMLRQGRTRRRCGVKTSGFTDFFCTTEFHRFFRRGFCG